MRSSGLLYILHSRTHFITEIMHPQSYYSMLGLHFILENNQIQNLLTPLKNILTSQERPNGYTSTCPPANMAGSQWPCLTKWPRDDAHSIDITDMLQQYPMSEHSWDHVWQSITIMASSTYVQLTHRCEDLLLLFSCVGCTSTPLESIITVNSVEMTRTLHLRISHCRTRAAVINVSFYFSIQ